MNTGGHLQDTARLPVTISDPNLNLDKNCSIWWFSTAKDHREHVKHIC